MIFRSTSCDSSGSGQPLGCNLAVDISIGLIYLEWLRFMYYYKSIEKYEGRMISHLLIH